MQSEQSFCCLPMFYVSNNSVSKQPRSCWDSNTVTCGNLMFGYVIKCFFPGRVQVQSRETSKFKSVWYYFLFHSCLTCMCVYMYCRFIYVVSKFITFEMFLSTCILYSFWHVKDIYSPVYYLLICLKAAGWVANSVDPDQTMLFVASDLGLSIPILRINTASSDVLPWVIHVVLHTTVSKIS